MWAHGPVAWEQGQGETRRTQPGCLCVSWLQDTEHWGLSGASCFVLGGKVDPEASAVRSTLLPYHMPWTEYLHPLPNARVETLTPHVIVFGDGALGGN